MSIALMTAAWALEIGATDKIVLLALVNVSEMFHKRSGPNGACNTSPALTNDEGLVRHGS